MHQDHLNSPAAFYQQTLLDLIAVLDFEQLIRLNHRLKKNNLSSAANFILTEIKSREHNHLTS